MQFEWFDAARRGDETFLKDNIDTFAQQQDKQGRTALVISVQHGHNRCVDLLIAKEAGIETEKGWTAIMYAIKYDNMTAFKRLLALEGAHLTKKNILPLYVAVQYTAHEYVKLLLPQYAKDKKHLAEFFRFAVSTADGDTIKQFLPHLTTKQINHALRAMIPDDLGVLYVYSNLQEAEKNERSAARARAELKRASSVSRKRPSSGYGMGQSGQLGHTVFGSSRKSTQASRTLSRPGSALAQQPSTQPQPFSGPAQIPPPGRQHYQNTPPTPDSTHSVNARHHSTSAIGCPTYHQNNLQGNHTAYPSEAVGVDEDDCEIIFSAQHARMQRLQQHEQPSPLPITGVTRHTSAGSRLPQETPLMHAARIGDLGVAMRSMQYVRNTQKDGTTALMIACDRGHYEIAALLYDYEKQMRRKDGRTALMISIANGTPELVQLLMESEARYQTEDGKTALMVAAMHGREDLAALLVSKEARMTDIQRTTALIYATTSRREGIVRLLAGMEAGMKTRNGSTALCFAAVLGYRDIAEILLPYEEDVTEEHGRTPLMLACQHGNSDVIQLLSTTRMVGATDTRGCTALMECANAGFYQGAGLLLAHECRHRNKEGMTAMMYAAAAGHLDIVAILRDYEVGIQSNEGFTALIYGLTSSVPADTKLQIIELLGLAEWNVIVRKGRPSMDYLRDHCEPLVYQALQDLVTNTEMASVVDVVHKTEPENLLTASPEPAYRTIRSHGSGHASMVPGNMSVKSSDRGSRATLSPNAPDVDIHYSVATDGSAFHRPQDSPVESISVPSLASDIEHHIQEERLYLERNNAPVNEQASVSMSIASDL